jgi:hypothetical protein
MFKKMNELYEENGMKFYRKLVVEDHHWLYTEKKLSEAEEKISHSAEGLETYKKVSRELGEKLERTNHYYQRQMISYEEKKKLILIGQ